MDSHKLNAFLNELSELSCKHGIVIHGCGCCGSPYLKDHGEMLAGSYTVVNDDVDTFDLRFVEE